MNQQISSIENSLDENNQSEKSVFYDNSQSQLSQDLKYKSEVVRRRFSEISDLFMLKISSKQSLIAEETKDRVKAEETQENKYQLLNVGL